MEYELRVSPRARYLRVEVPFGGPPLVVVPRGVSQARVDAFLAEKRPWIERQLARQVTRLELPLLTEAAGRRRAREAATELARQVTRLELPLLTEAAGRRRAREVATGLAEREAARLGVSFRRIRIADQRSRWGSCSSRGTLSFNWRLVLAPAEVLDYVVVHELCHLREPNHSRRFWALVEAARPGWRAQREWLRDYGPELLAYRPG